MRLSTVVAITAVLVAASGVAGCSGSSSSSSSGLATKALAPENQGAGGGAAFGDVSGQAATVAGPTQAQRTSLRSHDGLPQMPSTVIKTGRLSIRLGHDGLSKATDRITAGRRQLRRIHQLEQHLVWQARTSTIVLRVPAARFDAAMRQLRAPGLGAVRSEQVSGEDVGHNWSTCRHARATCAPSHGR